MVNQISIPLSFADGLYGLRSHVRAQAHPDPDGEHPAPEVGEPV
jgi:hypothetical protein